MNELIKLIIEYQKSNSDEVFEKIINLLEGVIKFILIDVDLNIRDDVYQEIVMKIYKIILKVNLEKFKSLNIEIYQAKIFNYIKKNNYIYKINLIYLIMI